MCIVVSTPPHLLKNTTPSFLPSPPLNLQTVQTPFFWQFPPIYWFFEHPPFKNWISGWTPEILKSYILKGCFCYIFASLFCLSKKGHLWNKEKCFLFPFESSFLSWNKQILRWPVSVTAKPKIQGKTKKTRQNKKATAKQNATAK